MKSEDESYVAGASAPDHEVPEYVVGGSRLVFGELAFESGTEFYGMHLLAPGQLEFLVAGGHLIRSQE